MSLPFLLEIGTEEIPDWMISGALESLKGQLEGLGIAARMDATPRRLTARAVGLPERLPDSEERVMGPPRAANPKAVEGFARKLGVAAEDLKVETTAKGEYYTYLRKVEGRRMIDILAEALPGIILKITFPKTMYWTGKGGPRFIRPIRWLVALLGGEVIPFELAGVRSGNVTSGHRRLGAARNAVTIGDYEQTLRDNFVILSADERRRKIGEGITALGVRLKADAALLETLVYLTEFPTPIMGEFDPQFLELPEEVLITVMRHHQRYFSVEDESGHLAPRFVAVMNTSADPDGLVRQGNERVLRARFNDARFFWQADQRKKLAERVDDLAHVTFQAKLGSYLEKTERVVTLVKDLGGDEHAQRAAHLEKADLTTELVKEFTELQGVVGGLYARAQGEPDEVWQAVYDHYKPESMEDSIPRGRTGQLVSLADKLDTLRECFRIGMAPTGSRDPFALRRAAQGVVKIAVEGFNVPLQDAAGGDLQLEEFFKERVKFYFRDVRGFAYDEVNAAMAWGWANPKDLESRLVRLKRIRPTPDFERLAASFKRVKNILTQAGALGDVPPAIRADLVEPGPERELYAAMNTSQPIEEAIGALRPKVDSYFDHVLVNAPDPELRENRLAMLWHLLDRFRTFADFSEIVTNS